jgi:hypothetical protein
MCAGVRKCFTEEVKEVGEVKLADSRRQTADRKAVGYRPQATVKKGTPDSKYPVPNTQFPS